jgi:hypothetical protein
LRAERYGEEREYEEQQGGCRDDNLRAGVQESNSGHASSGARATAMGHSKGQRQGPTAGEAPAQTILWRANATNRWNRRYSAAWPPELSRGRGIRWPMANSWCSRTPRGYTSPRQKKFTPTSGLPPVEQFPLVSAASRYSAGSPSNLGGGRMLRGGPE